MSIKEFEKSLEETLGIQKARKVLNTESYITQEELPAENLRDYVKKLIDFEVQPERLFEVIPEELDEIYSQILNKINLKNYAKRILICLIRRSPLGLLAKEICRLAFLNLIRSKEFFSDVVSNNKDIKFLGYLLDNLDRINDLQSLLSGYRFENSAKIDRTAEQLLHQLFDSVDEEAFCQNLLRAIPDFAKFVDEFDLEELTEINLGLPDSFVPVDLPLLEIPDGMEDIQKATERIFTEFVSEIFVEALKGFEEIVCDDDLPFYKTPEAERFRGKSPDGDEIHRIMVDISKANSREDICRFLRGETSNTQKDLPAKYHNTVREIYSELPYDYCSNFDSSQAYRSLCNRDEGDRLELRKALKAFQKNNIGCPEELGELLGSENLSALSEFLKFQTKSLAETLKFAYTSKFLMLQEESKAQKPKPKLQSYYETKEIKQDEETTKKLKKFLKNKKFSSKNYSDIFKENFIPTLKVSLNEKLNYENTLGFPESRNGFLLDKKKEFRTNGFVDFKTGEYNKSGELPNGFLLDLKEKCKSFQLEISGSNRDFQGFSDNGSLLLTLIELEDLFLVKITGNKKELVPSKPLKVSTKDWELLTNFTRNDKQTFGVKLEDALKNRRIQVELPDIHSHFERPVTEAFNYLQKDELQVIYQNIFRSYFELVRNAELAGSSGVGRKSISNISKLPLGFDNVCDKKELLSFEDALELLPSDNCLETGEIDRLNMQIKSYLKFGAMSYILSSPFSFSSVTPKRGLYELVASSYVDSISTINDEIKKSFQKNCKVYKELFVDYCFSIHTQFMKNLNVKPYGFLPNVKKTKESWFYQTGELINQPWLAESNHHNFPFFLGSELQVYEKKKPNNTKNFGGLPDLVGKSVGSDAIRESLLKNPPKLPDFSEYYGFKLVSGVYFHAPLEFFKDGTPNSLSNNFWKNKYSDKREKATFDLLTQKYRTFGDYRGRYSYVDGVKGSDGSSTTSIKVRGEIIYESTSVDNKGPAKSFKITTDLGTFTTIKELQSLQVKTQQGLVTVFGNNFTTIEEFLELDGLYNETSGSREKGLDERLRKPLDFTERKNFKSDTILFPLVQRELKLNIVSLSQLIFEKPEKKNNFEVSEEFLELKNGNWVCSTKKVIREEIEPAERLWVLDIEECYNKSFEDLSQTDAFRLIQSYFKDDLLFSYVVLDEGIFHSNTLSLKDVYAEFLQKLKKTVNFENETPEFAFDVSGILRSAPLTILKGLTETFDPNISVANLMRTLVQSGVETGLEVIDQEIDFETPLLPYSLALLPLGLFPTPFGVVYLGVDLVDELLTANEESNLFNSEFPIANPEICND